MLFLEAPMFLCSYIREIRLYLSFTVWLTSLSIMPSRSIHHMVSYGKIFFLLWLNNISSYKSIYFRLYIFKCISLTHVLSIYIYMYISHLYPFIPRWVLRLFPCLGCCEQCCGNRWMQMSLGDSYFMWKGGTPQLWGLECLCCESFQTPFCASHLAPHVHPSL